MFWSRNKILIFMDIFGQPFWYHFQWLTLLLSNTDSKDNIDMLYKDKVLFQYKMAKLPAQEFPL